MQKLLTYYGEDGEIWIESESLILDLSNLDASKGAIELLEDYGFTVLTGDCGTKCYIELDCGTQASFDGVEWELIKTVNKVY